MPSTKLTHIIMATVLGVLATHISVKANGDAVHKTETAILSAPQKVAGLGDISIQLVPTKDGSFSCRWDGARPFVVDAADKIIAIDGVYTKGRSLQDLQRRLKGPLGSTAVIILYSPSYEQVTRVTVNRLPPHSKPPASDYYRALGAITLYDRINPEQPVDRIVEECHRAGSDLWAGAVLTDQLHQGRGSGVESRSVFLSKALEFFDATGMFECFETAKIEILENSLDPIETSDYTNLQALLNSADYLSQDARQMQLAETIYQRLNAGVATADESHKRIVSRNYGRFLADKKSESEALPVYEQLEALCASNDDAANLDDLRAAADFYLKTHHYPQALSAYQSLLRLAADRMAQENDPNAHALNVEHRKFLIETLINLSDTYMAQGDYAHACDFTEKALNIYKEQLNSEELVRLERASTPCLSDVEVRLGGLLAKCNRLNDAIVVTESGIERKAEALGWDNPSLKGALESLASFYVTLGERVKADLNSAKAKIIAPTAPATTNEEPMTERQEYAQARAAYEAIQSQRFGESTSLIDKLLATERKRKTHNDDTIARLINLSKALDTNGKRTDSLRLLEQLSPFIKQEATDPSRVYQKAEVALMADETKADQSKLRAAWHALENAICEPWLIESSSENPTVAKVDEQTKEHTSLLLRELTHLALAYSLNGEPAKSSKLLKRVLGQYQGDKVWQATDLAELALAQVIMHDLPSAQANLDLAISLHPHLSVEFDARLAQVARALYAQHRPIESELLLKKALNAAQERSPFDGKSILVRELAKIEMSRGSYREAEKLLRDYHLQWEGLPSVDPVLPLAQCLDFQHKDREALELYFDWRTSGFGKEAEKTTIISRALELFSRSHITDDKLITAFYRMALSNVPMPEENNRYCALLSQIIDKLPIEKNAMFKQLRWNLAANYERQGRFSLVRKVLEPAAREQEANHDPGAAGTWREIGRSEVENRHYLEGAQSILHAYSLIPTATEHEPYGLNDRNSVCFHEFMKAKEYDRLESIIKACIRAGESTNRKPDNLALSEISLLAEFYVRSAQYDKALAVTNELTAKIMSSNLDKSAFAQPGGENVTSILLPVAEAYLAQSKFTDAETLVEKVVSMQKENLGPEDSNFIKSFMVLAAISGAQKKFDQEESLLRRCLEIAARNYGAESANTTDVRAAYAACLRDLGRRAEAEKVSMIASESDSK